MCALYFRDNLKNSCRLDVTVNSYLTVLEGKKVYNRGRTINLAVDPEHYALIDLEKDIDGYFKWGSHEKPVFWVVGKGDKWQCKLASDAQFLDLLRSSDLVKLFMTVGRRQDEEETMCAAANVVAKEMPAITDTATATYVVCEEMTGVVDVVAKEKIGTAESGDEDMHADMEWREVPEYGQTTAGPPMAEEEEKEHFMTAGCDPDGDEPIGSNEEWRYFKLVDGNNVKPVEVQQTRKRARPILDFDIDSVPDDVAGLVDDYVVPHTTYDKENPVIKEGDTFEDKDEFLETIRTYAIRNEFETKIEHSDKERYRARCKDASCEWKVFAKRLHGGNTFMVLFLSSCYIFL